jgi:hypothetical protein
VLSLTQERLWYLYQLDPASPVYNVPFISRLSGSLDVTALERALDLVVERHDALRTAIVLSKGSPIPLVLKKRPMRLRQVDLRHLAPETARMELDRLIREEAARPFDLSREHLFRAALFRIADDGYVFYHDAPHIVFEGGSLAVLYRDLSVIYNGLVEGKAPVLPELAFEYLDFALWQRNHLQSGRLEALNRHWRQQLDGAPQQLHLPLDFPRPAVQSFHGTRSHFSLPAEVLSAANTFFENSGVTPYRGMLAAFLVFLWGYTGMTDILLGSPVVPNIRGIENLIGFFVNTVVLRTRLDGCPTFRQLLRRVSVTVHRAITGSDLPFHKIVEAVQPARDPSRTPLFQVNFRCVHQRRPHLQMKDITAGLAEYVDNGTAKFDLALDIESSAGECYFEYSTGLFREGSILRMEGDFQDVLADATGKPDIPLSQLDSVARIRARVRQNIEQLHP